MIVLEVVVIMMEVMVILIMVVVIVMTRTFSQLHFRSQQLINCFMHIIPLN